MTLSMSTGKAATGENVTEFKTKRALASRFLRHRAAQLIIAGAVATALVRIFLGLTSLLAWGYSDLAAATISISLIGVVEWLTHKFLFHAAADSKRNTIFETSKNHRQHHLDPVDMGWLLLHPRGARILMTGVGLVVVSFAIPLGLFVGPTVFGPLLTGLAIGWASMANYEWTHLLVHSGYRPKSRWYKRLAKHHRQHHYRNENFWLGVTNNMGDRVFRTLPSRETKVPLSDTARTL